jgi:hypothetical protein
VAAAAGNLAAATFDELSPGRLVMRCMAQTGQQRDSVCFGRLA